MSGYMGTPRQEGKTASSGLPVYHKKRFGLSEETHRVETVLAL